MIDRFIDDVDRRLVMRSRKRARILQEVREHLDDAVAQLASHSFDQSTAESRAIAAFGTAPALASDLNGQVAAEAFRRTPLTMAVSGFAVVAGLLLAALAQPHQAVSASADIVQQVAFFAGVLGLQFAFVAGVRALIRVGARWSVTPTEADQRLIRNAEVVFVAGLAVAAGGWTVALADAFADTAVASWPLLVAGEILMIGPSIVTCVATSRRRWPPIGDGPVRSESSLHTGRSSIFGLAERCIESVGRQPLVWCAGVASAAAISAMSHAETTVKGALVWGAIQALAVVAGFVLLGRLLELRSPRSAHAVAD